MNTGKLNIHSIIHRRGETQNVYTVGSSDPNGNTILGIQKNDPHTWFIDLPKEEDERQTLGSFIYLFDPTEKIDVTSFRQEYEDGREEIWKVGDLTTDGIITEFVQAPAGDWYALTDTPSPHQLEMGQKNGWSWINQLERAKPEEMPDPLSLKASDVLWVIVRVIAGILLVYSIIKFEQDQLSLGSFIIIAVLCLLALMAKGIYSLISLPKEIIEEQNGEGIEIFEGDLEKPVYGDDSSFLVIEEQKFFERHERTPENIKLWEKQKEAYNRGF